jgi:uncharacterized repeat protein (TIGR01451 family)
MMLMQTSALMASAHLGSAYVCNRESKSVSVIDLDTTDVVQQIALPDAISDPVHMTIAPDRMTGYVSNLWGQKSLSKIDLHTGATLEQLAVGSMPTCTAITADGSKAFVTHWGTSGTVSVVDLVTKNVTKTIDVGSLPLAIALTPDQAKAYVCNVGSNGVSVIDVANNEVVTSIPAGIGPADVAMAPDGSKAYVCSYDSNTVSVIDTSIDKVVSVIDVGMSPQGITIAGDGTKAYVCNSSSDTISVIGLPAGVVEANLEVGHGPKSIAVTPTGHVGYVCHARDNTVSVVDLTTCSVMRTITVDECPSFVTMNPSAPLYAELSVFPTTMMKEGDQIMLRMAVANTGKGPISNIRAVCGILPFTFDTTTLDVRQVAHASALYTISEADIAAGSVTFSAVVSGTLGGKDVWNETNEVVVSSPSEEVALSKAPSIQLDKIGSTTIVTVGGTQVVYTFVVTNSGDSALTGVSVTDSKMGSISLGTSVLTPGATTSGVQTYTVTQADKDAGVIVNIATASGTTLSTTVTDSAGWTASVVQSPSISLNKTANVTQVDATGDLIQYSFTVTNTGNVTLSNVGVADTKVGAVTFSSPTLAPGGVSTALKIYTVALNDMNAGSIINVATASGTPPTGLSTVTANDSVTVDVLQNPSIQLTKSTTFTSVTAAGTNINYTFTVTNNGNVSLSNVTINDTLCGGLILSGVTLNPAGTTTVSGTHTVSQTEMNLGASIVNVATATGNTPPGTPTSSVSSVASASVTVFQQPQLTLVKGVTPSNVLSAGTVLTYSFQVTNSGNISVTGITLSDPTLSGLGIVLPPVGNLEPGNVATVTANYTVPQTTLDLGTPIINTATASGIKSTPTGGTLTSNSSTASVTFTRSPAVTLSKTANVTSVTAAGAQIGYTFTVTNSGNVTLSGVSIADSKVGTVTVSPSTLLPGATATGGATYTVLLSDMDAGSIHNAATASATPPTGLSTVTNQAGVTVTAVQTPVISLTKTAAPTSATGAGNLITYSYVVGNTGNVTLHGLGVVDGSLGTVTLGATSIAPGATTSGSKVYTITLNDMNLGATLINTAGASGTSPLPTGTVVTAGATAGVGILQSPSLSISKTPSPTSATGTGPIQYTYVVTNTGNVSLNGITVTDSRLGTITMGPSSIAPGATSSGIATYTVSLSDMNAGATLTNTATATGTPFTGSPATNTASAAVPVIQSPGLTIAKIANPTVASAAGTVVTYSFVVTNSGNVTVSNISVLDAALAARGLTWPSIGSLDPGGVATVGTTYSVPQSVIDAGVTLTNTATALGTKPTGGTFTSSPSTATVGIQGVPGIEIVKLADQTTVATAGTLITYSFTVSNTGTMTLVNVGVTDSKLGTITLPTATIGVSGVATGTKVYTVLQSDIDANLPLVNTATAVARAGVATGPGITGVSSESVAVLQEPQITIVKGATPGNVTVAGTPVTYSYVVTNSGNTTLSSIAAVDNKVGAISLNQTSLAPGMTASGVATYTVTLGDINLGDPIVNTVTVTGSTPQGVTYADTDSAFVTVTQSPAMSLVKAANPTVVLEANTPITYTFTVTNTGNVTLTNVTVTDDAHDGLFTLTDGNLNPGGVTMLTHVYTATQVDIDAGVPLVNTAVATAASPSGHVSSNTETVSVDVRSLPRIAIMKSAGPITDTDANGPDVGDTILYTFLVTNSGNTNLSNIRVDDTKIGLSGVVLTSGLAPGATSSVQRIYTLTQEDVDAGVIVNVATATATPPTGSDVAGEDQLSTPIAVTPQIGLTKSTASSPTRAGDPVVYDFLVTNIGTVTLDDITLTDPKLGLDHVVVGGPIGPGATLPYVSTYTASQADVDSGAIVNTAEVVGESLDHGDATATASAEVIIVPQPALRLFKVPISSTTDLVLGSTVTYEFLAQNIGNVTLTNVTIADAQSGGVLLTGATIAPNASVSATGTHTITQADVDAAHFTNTATVEGTAPLGGSAVAMAQATVHVMQSPAIDVAKSVVDIVAPSEKSCSFAEGTIEYRFVVTNSGTVTLHNIVLTDETIGVTLPVGTLAPGQQSATTTTYTITHHDVNTRRVKNTVTAVGDTPQGATVIDSATLITTIPVRGVIPPSKFFGKVERREHHHHDEKPFNLEMRWQKSPDPDADFYRIYADGECIGKVSQKSDPKFEVHIHSKKVYKTYKIATVTCDRRESMKIKMIVVKHHHADDFDFEPPTGPQILPSPLG